MPWLKLCDKWRNHTKVRKSGLLAAGLHAALMSYSGDTLSDGVFHPDDLEDVWPWGFDFELDLVLELLAPVFARVLGEDAQQALRDELQSFRLPPRVVLAKLLERLQVKHRGERGALVEKHGRRGKLRLYNYDKYNPTRDQHEARQAAAAFRQQRKRERQKAESQLAAELATHIVHAQVGVVVPETTTSRRDSRGTTHVMDPVTAPAVAGLEESAGSQTSEVRSSAAAGADAFVLRPRPDPSVTHGADLVSEGEEAAGAKQKRQRRAEGEAPLPTLKPEEAFQRGEALGFRDDGIRAYKYLREHEVLARVATPEMAAQCALWQRDFRKSDEEVEAAIAGVARDAGARAAIGKPLSDAQVADKLGRFIEHGRAPKQQDSGARSEQEHYELVRAQGARVAQNRARGFDDESYMERGRQQAAVDRLLRGEEQPNAYDAFVPDNIRGELGKTGSDES